MKKKGRREEKNGHEGKLHQISTPKHAVRRLKVRIRKLEVLSIRLLYSLYTAIDCVAYKNAIYLACPPLLKRHVFQDGDLFHCHVGGAS